MEGFRSSTPSAVRPVFCDVPKNYHRNDDDPVKILALSRRELRIGRLAQKGCRSGWLRLAFSRCIREVEAGEEYVITRKGQPVALLVPVAGRRAPTPAQQAARARARMEKGWPIDAGPLDRDALHERR
ncbi:MAG TPA: type II toxin-antitoxin system prevent-host-death family antitoxin [Stellaceae bacterium]|nr:type II toxin-antitoxin system prevent-host-death family antitoxin [Stellaceae bacterium]